MAERKRDRRKENRSRDAGVIASRIIQDIINNSSQQFQEFLQRRSASDAAALAGGGATPPPSLWDVPGMAPPLQGPPVPANYNPPIVESRNPTDTYNGRIPNPTYTPMPTVDLPPLGPSLQPPVAMPQQMNAGPDVYSVLANPEILRLLRLLG